MRRLFFLIVLFFFFAARRVTSARETRASTPAFQSTDEAVPCKAPRCNAVQLFFFFCVSSRKYEKEKD
jgi:hypothetical protein